MSRTEFVRAHRRSQHRILEGRSGKSRVSRDAFHAYRLCRERVGSCVDRSLHAIACLCDSTMCACVQLCLRRAVAARVLSVSQVLRRAAWAMATIGQCLFMLSAHQWRPGSRALVFFVYKFIEAYPCSYFSKHETARAQRRALKHGWRDFSEV